MIARAWHGAVPTEQAEKYASYVQETGVSDLRATTGNLGVYLLRRIDGDSAHFLVISLWQGQESIRAFAGEDLDRARYYARDPDFLLELEPHVIHYEVLVQPDPLETDAK